MSWHLSLFWNTWIFRLSFNAFMYRSNVGTQISLVGISDSGTWGALEWFFARMNIHMFIKMYFVKKAFDRNTCLTLEGLLIFWSVEHNYMVFFLSGFDWPTTKVTNVSVMDSLFVSIHQPIWREHLWALGTFEGFVFCMERLQVVLQALPTRQFHSTHWADSAVSDHRLKGGRLLSWLISFILLSWLTWWAVHHMFIILPGVLKYS